MEIVLASNFWKLVQILLNAETAIRFEATRAALLLPTGSTCN